MTVTPAAIQEALDTVARPAVAGPLTVVGDGKNATVTSRAITTFLTFRPDGQGGLTPGVDEPAAIAAVEPQLGTTETEPRDATLDVRRDDGDRRAGRRRPRDRLAADLRRDRRGARAARTTGPPRRSSPRRRRRPAPSRRPRRPRPAARSTPSTRRPSREVTTESLQALGPAAADRGVHHPRASSPTPGRTSGASPRSSTAQIIAPNSVFSLNEAIEPPQRGQRLRRPPGSSTTAPRAAASAAASPSSRRRSSTRATSRGSTTSSTRSTATTSAATRRAVRRPSSRARSTCGSATTGPRRSTSAPSGPRRRSRCSSTASSASR